MLLAIDYYKWYYESKIMAFMQSDAKLLGSKAGRWGSVHYLIVQRPSYRGVLIIAFGRS